MSDPNENTLNYSVSVPTSSSISHIKITPTRGLNTIVLGSSPSEELTYNIPNTVYNLAKSYLALTITPAADASYYQYLRVDFSPILFSFEFVSLETGVIIDSCNNLDLHQALATPYAHSKNLMKSNPKRTGTNPFVPSFESILANNVSPANGTLGDADRGMRVTAVGTLAGADPVLNIEIPFAQCGYHTILGLDKMVFFNSNTALKFVLNRRERLGNRSTSATDPSTNAGSISKNVSVSSPYLWLATEKNAKILESVKSHVMSKGLNVLFQHSDCNTFSQAGGSTASGSTIRVSSLNGARLVRVYHTLMDNRFQSNTLFQRNAFTNVSTILDGVYLENKLNEQEYFRSIQSLLRNTCVESFDHWDNLYKAVVIDFSGRQDLTADALGENMAVGLDLSDAKTLEIQYEHASLSDFLHAYSIVSQRVVRVDRNGIQILTVA